jgi:RimJ/RimL family protein N-acetyltransferase
MGGVYRRALMTAGTPSTLADAWPIFGLRLRTARLVLRLPTDDDLVALADLARDGIHGADEMPFARPWSTIEGPAFYRNFVGYHWTMRGAWTPESWTLNLMIELDGAPIGSQSILAERFATFRTVRTGSWLGRAFQRRGYGREMREAVLGFGFDGLGALVAETEAFTDNAASNAVSRSLGYAENGIEQFAPLGVPRDVQRFRMTIEDWRSRPRPALTIEGLEACRDLFGAS